LFIISYLEHIVGMPTFFLIILNLFLHFVLFFYILHLIYQVGDNT